MADQPWGNSIFMGPDQYCFSNWPARTPVLRSTCSRTACSMTGCQGSSSPTNPPILSC